MHLKKGYVLAIRRCPGAPSVKVGDLLSDAEKGLSCEALDCTFPEDGMPVEHAVHAPQTGHPGRSGEVASHNTQRLQSWCVSQRTVSVAMLN